MALRSLFLMFLLLATPLVADDGLQVLFLGDNGHHRPEDRFLQLEPVLAKRGIQLTYVADPDKVLNAETLAKYDGLLLYANIDAIAKPHADALLAYVASGKGFIPLHCATFCFRNDDRIVALMGGQFKSHGGEVFSTVIAEPDHPIMQGYGSFTSWDETYVHTAHNPKDRTVLEYRVQGMQAAGQDREPWTWIRTYEQGRVFYTAWGHDERTWSNPGFQNLVERGIRWACGDDPQKAGVYRERGRFEPLPMTEIAKDLRPFEYIEVGAKIPHYIKSDKWGEQAAPLTTMQLPLPAEESMKHYVVPQGFELRIFATEKFADDGAVYAQLGGKPIAMSWDERGRLWVCETIDYPNELQPQNKGRDRIRICEDTDGDGQADKFTVFAEGLSIPTAVLPIFGGAVVQNGTETLFLKDTDGDDRADVREVLITGWSLGDTHGGVGNFRYGLDNWVYAMQGYNDSQPVIKATGEQGPRFRQGFWRMKLGKSKAGNDGSEHVPVVEKIEFLRSTNNNTWGLGISEEGLVFGSTANHNPSEFMPIANRYYERVRGWGPSRLEGIADTFLFKPITDKVRQVDQFGGYTAGAGHALYTARNYPEQYWNRTAFTCGPTGHLVGTFVLTPDGAGYKSTSPCNLVAADDEWAAPIMAEVGPDGNVWVLDWYNYIIQHNPTPQGFRNGRGNAYESDLRDKKHGRIYRLVYTAAKPGDGIAGSAGKAADLSQATSEQLVAALGDPTMERRLHAQRLLLERGDTAVVPALVKLAADQSVDEVGLNVAAIHALATLAALGANESSEHLVVWEQALRHPSAGVRRVAAATLPNTNESVAMLLQSGVLSDDNAQVRLAAILALADLPNVTAAGKEVTRLARDAAGTMNDRWLADAVTSAAAAHSTSFLKALSSDEQGAASNARAANSPEWPVVRRVAEHIARGEPDAAAMERLLTAIDGGSPQLINNVLDGLLAGWQRDYNVQLSEPSEAALVKLLERVDGADKAKVLRLASLCGSQAMAAQAATIVESMLSAIRDTNLSMADRRAAAQQLISFQPADETVVANILAELTPQTQPELATGLIAALGGSTAKNVGPEMVDRVAAATPVLREQILKVLLSRPQTTIALLDGVEAGVVSLGDLKLDQKMALTAHPTAAIRDRARELLKAGGGLPDPDRQKVLDAMLEITKVEGDAVLGKEVFKKNCAKCHKHSGEGENIGPDLTGMAVHPKSELLVHILDPSRSVEGNFRSYTVVMDDGLIHNGMLAGESQTAIELIDGEAKKFTLVRQDIEQIIASNKSVMPEGFEKTIPRADFVNLLEFLTAKGKYVPLDLRKVATIVSTKSMFIDEANDAERLIFADWGPKMMGEVPFLLVDPKGDTVPNVVLLHGPNGKWPPQMPKSVELPLNGKAKTIHLLSGVSGWGYPYGQERTVSMIVRLHYADGTTEDHPLRNGVEFADYIRRVDVPGSQFAFALRGQQIRYLSVDPKRQDEVVTKVELVKGPDGTSPVVMAITIETP
ncbi:MAG: ThuA domain-containing protein [Planctomycetaceae bacterium]